MSENKKVFKFLILMIMILTLPLIIILSNFQILLNNEQFFKAEFKKFNVYQDYPEAEILNEELLQYFNGKANLPETKLNEREIKHMIDVKKTFDTLKILLYALIIVFIINLAVLPQTLEKEEIWTKEASKSTLYGALLLIIISAVSSAIFLNFTFFFDKFHYLFFEAGSWVLPKTSILVQTYPEEFFLDGASAIMLMSLASAITILITSYILIKINTKKIK